MARRLLRTLFLLCALSSALALAAVGSAGSAIAAAPAARFGADGIVFHAGPQRPAGGNYGAGIADLAPLRGGKMVAAVFLTTGERGQPRFSAARFRADGSLDRGFGSGGFARTAPGGAGDGYFRGAVEAVAVQPNGRILLAGYRTHGRGEEARYPVLLRLLPDGRLDRSFGRDGVVMPRREAGFGEWYSDVAVESSGRIVVSGAVTQTSGTQAPHARLPTALVRAFRPDGRLDRSFGAGGTTRVTDPRTGFYYSGLGSIQVLPGGALLASGYSRYRLRLEKLTADGRLGGSFGRDGLATFGEENSDCLYVCEWSSGTFVRKGKIVVMANLGYLGQTRAAVLRYLPDGRLDKSFGHGGVFWEGAGEETMVESEAVAPARGGKFVVAGYGADYDSAGGEGLAVAGLAVNGLRDRTFGNHHGFYNLGHGTGGSAYAALGRGDGSVVVSGATSFRRRDDVKSGAAPFDSGPGLMTLIRFTGAG